MSIHESHSGVAPESRARREWRSRQRAGPPPSLCTDRRFGRKADASAFPTYLAMQCGHWKVSFRGIRDRLRSYKQGLLQLGSCKYMYIADS
jgi:hypothetical protein